MNVDKIALRHCGVSDAAALSLIGSATFLEAFADVLDGESILLHCQNQHGVATYEKYLARPETRAWLAIVPPGGAAVGYAMLTEPDLPLSDLTCDDIELKRIYLFSRFRGLGAGKLLMEQSISAARKANKRRLLLGVNAENNTALAFYRKNGFLQVGVRTFQVGNRIHDDLVLGLNL